MEKKKLKDFERCIFNIDMVEGFVNIGPMSNKKYNLLVPAQKEIMDDIRKDGESLLLEKHIQKMLQNLKIIRPIVKWELKKLNL